MKHPSKQVNCRVSPIVSTQVPLTLHQPVEPVPDSPKNKRQSAKAALNSLPTACLPGAPPRRPMVPTRLNREMVPSLQPQLPSLFALEGETEIDGEIYRPVVALPVNGNYAGRAISTGIAKQGLLRTELSNLLPRADSRDACLDPPLAQAKRAAPIDAAPVFSTPTIHFAPLDRQVIDPAHRHHTLVTRWDFLPRETSSESARYGSFMATSIERAAHALSSGQIVNLDQLWHRARDARLDSILVQKQVASPDDLSVEDTAFFRSVGTERYGVPLTTPMTGRYGYIKQSIIARVKEVFRNGTNAETNRWVAGDLTLFHNTAEKKRGTGTYQLRIATPSEPDINMHPPMLWDIDTGADSGTITDFDRSEDVTIGYLVNPMVDEALSTDRFALTFSHAQAQTSILQALQATDRDAILDHAFAAYWTLVVAAPDARGSAAKSHYVLQSVLLAKGIDLPPAGAGLAPDLEAMSRSRSAWQVRAREVFGL